MERNDAEHEVEGHANDCWRVVDLKIDPGSEVVVLAANIAVQHGQFDIA